MSNCNHNYFSLLSVRAVKIWQPIVWKTGIQLVTWTLPQSSEIFLKSADKMNWTIRSTFLLCKMQQFLSLQPASWVAPLRLVSASKADKWLWHPSRGPGQPPCQVMSVRPSGRFLSDLDTPVGSLLLLLSSVNWLYLVIFVIHYLLNCRSSRFSFFSVSYKLDSPFCVDQRINPHAQYTHGHSIRYFSHCNYWYSNR